jgi:predicted  nucleic acid-binding Zn-ribbon protein
MAAAGLEKFSHLEDKIYRTVELCKTLKQEKDYLEREIKELKHEVANLMAEKAIYEKKIEALREDRENMRLKVEAMLDAIAMLELEAESLKK